MAFELNIPDGLLGTGQMIVLPIPEGTEDLHLPDPTLLNYYRNRANRKIYIYGEITDELVDQNELIMQYNMESSMEKYADIAVAMGVDVQSLSLREKAQAAVDAVRKLAIEVNIPQKLSMLGVDKAALPALAKAALVDVCTPGNPRKVELSDIQALYEQAF